MIIDLFFAMLMVLAIFKGYSRGLILGFLSFAGFFIGLAAAMQMSAVVANYISNTTGTNGKWLPFVAFALVFAATVFLVNMVGSLLQKTMQAAMLGWANRLSGILLFAAIYSILFSLAIFFLSRMQIIPKDVMTQSMVYPFLKNLAPAVIDVIGIVLPFVADAFEDLKEFFAKLAEKA